MIFITLIFFKYKPLLTLLLIAPFLSNCYRALLWSSSIYFFSEVEVILYSFSSSDAILNLLIFL